MERHAIIIICLHKNVKYSIVIYSLTFIHRTRAKKDKVGFYIQGDVRMNTTEVIHFFVQEQLISRTKWLLAPVWYRISLIPVRKRQTESTYSRRGRLLSRPPFGYLFQKLFASLDEVAQGLALEHIVCEQGEIHSLLEQLIVSSHGSYSGITCNLLYQRILGIHCNIV